MDFGLGGGVLASHCFEEVEEIMDFGLWILDWGGERLLRFAFKKLKRFWIGGEGGLFGLMCVLERSDVLCCL